MSPGTVLGPLLLLTYINYLPSCMSRVPSQSRLFADDCLLYRPIKCLADQEKLQRGLSALQGWQFVCWGGGGGGVLLRVSRPKFNNLYSTLKCETLTKVSSTSYLGVCLRETLIEQVPLRAFFGGTGRHVPLK